MNEEHTIRGTPVEELISADLDDALSPETAEALAEHLRTCASCRRLAVRHRHLHEQLGRPMEAQALAQARSEIWSGIQARTAAPSVRLLPVAGRLALAAGVLVVAALVGLQLAGRLPVAGPVPAREEVASMSFELPDGGSGGLVVEQGSALALPGEQIGVGARAELRFSGALGNGVAEIRFRKEDDVSYGILASAPDLAGRTSTLFGGSFPPLQGTSSVTYELWLHFESDRGTADTSPLLIDILQDRGGERARPR